MKVLDVNIFRQMLENAENNLLNYQKEIDAKNVFPVPDGDTGTNMTMTFQNGVLESKKISSDRIGDIAKGLSFGLLMGARGNSGVITSQIFRGFYQGVDKEEEVTVRTLAKAFLKGSEIAYKAVMKPVEGTILTVIRESSTAAYEFVKKNKSSEIEEYFDVLVSEAQKSLDHTPDLMPLLKEVGVVDSGGYGLVIILDAFRKAVHGEKIRKMIVESGIKSVQTKIEAQEFGYCTEFILELSETGRLTYDEDKLRRNLSRLGNSLVVVSDENLVKVHVHTVTPGFALNLAQRYGEFIKIKIENMTLQHEHIIDMAKEEETSEEKPKQKFALVSVCAGEGLTKTFKELRVDQIVSGGQTMNPSTEDFVDVIKKLNAEHVYVFPNNSNIFLAANQAKEICSDIDVHVFNTRTIQEGISACMAFNPEAEHEDNIADMEEAIEHVISGRITYAIKDSSVEGVDIKKDDFMGICGSHIIISDPDIRTAAKALIDSMVNEDAEIFTLISGCDAKAEDTEVLKEYIETKYDLEVEEIQGDQPVFYYLFSVE